MPKRIPNILLIGAGRFGKNHLRILSDLEREGRITLAGVVVKSEHNRAELAKNYGDRVHTSVSHALLSRIDGVVIATPSATHERLALRCIRYAPVLLEKPIALTDRGAQRLVAASQRYGHALVPGHTFRFHPATHALMRALKDEHPRSITGRFVSPIDTHHDENGFFEEMHLFDVLGYVLRSNPQVVRAQGSTTLGQVDLRYAHAVDAHLTVGWQGDEKNRWLSFETASGKRITVDYTELKVTVRQKNKSRIIPCPLTLEPLRAEHEYFLQAISRGRPIEAQGKAGRAVVAIAERATQSLVQKPTIAVIGGGIFGLTAGLVLGKDAQVTIFERHADIMTEASRVNQYRHHGGYHYPRSMETIDQIVETRDVFEKFYKGAVVKKPSYYCISNKGSRTSFKQFLEVCDAKKLPYKKSYPDPTLLDSGTVEGCILTNEYVYDYERLRALIRKRVGENRTTRLKLSHEITNIRLGADGKKVLTVRNRKTGKERARVFDVVINATYANHNRMCAWLKVPGKALEYRFKELAVVELPGAPQAAVTIMDGPFATMVPVGRTGLFTLGDVRTSVHKTGMSKFSDTSFRDWHTGVRSRYATMVTRCKKWFPALEQGRYIESMYVTLPIERTANSTDARTSSITDHGFGCYSVLEGKICTSVSIARQLKGLVKYTQPPASHR